MPTFKRNHEQVLEAFCILCVNRATPGVKLTENLKQILRDHVDAMHYDRNHLYLARGLCNGCRTRLCSLANPKVKSQKLPDINYDDLANAIRAIPVSTRSSTNFDCQCHYCERNRIPGPKLPISEFCGTPLPPATGGRPRTTPPPIPPRPIQFCSVCHAEWAPGKPHDCHPKHKPDNILKTMSPTTTEKVVSESMKTLAKAGETVALKAKRGLFHFTPGKKVDKPVEGLDHETIDMMKSKMNASGKSMLKGLGIARARTDVPIEPNYRAHMYQQNQLLKDYFTRIYEHFHENDPDATGKNVKGKRPQRGALKHFVYTP